jgi:hypothetical protein
MLHFLEGFKADGSFEAVAVITETLEEAKEQATAHAEKLNLVEWGLYEPEWDDEDEDEGCGGCDSCSCYEDDEGNAEM